MDIAALVNPVPAVSKLPTPPASNEHPPRKRRRVTSKRHEPKPIWAVREEELFEGKTMHEHVSQRLSPPPAALPPPRIIPTTSTELAGYERPISNDTRIYDDVSRQVCDFLWAKVIENQLVRDAIQESPDTQVEIEARWGKILERDLDQRAVGWNGSECVVKAAMNTKFESTMTIEQHKKMNMYLNQQVGLSKAPDAQRPEINYLHTRETDQFFELDQEGFDRLPPLTKKIIAQSGSGQRIRVTTDTKTQKPLRAIIKHKIANLEISSPNTEWDYRIGVNLEIKFPGPVTSAAVVERGKSEEEMKRNKDRVSYSWLDAYQVDLTQVSQGNRKIHELELELNSDLLINNADNIGKGLPSSFESLINGMMNNLRVLSREITPEQNAPRS